MRSLLLLDAIRCRIGQAALIVRVPANDDYPRTTVSFMVNLHHWIVVALLVGEMMEGVTNLKRPITEVMLKEKYGILMRLQEIYLTCFPVQSAAKATFELDDSSPLFFSNEACVLSDFMVA